MTKRVLILWMTKLIGLQGFFGIIFSLFQWEILFSHIFAPLFCSFHYNRKWLHFEFHLISGIWRGRMCFLWLLSFMSWKGHNCDLYEWQVTSRSSVIHKKVTIVTFLWTTLNNVKIRSQLDRDIVSFMKRSQLWPFYEWH